MKEKLYNISVSQLKDLVSPSQQAGIGDDFCIIDVRYNQNLDILKYPCRFDGYLICFCISGSLKVSINLREFDVGENTLCISIPGQINQILAVEDGNLDDLRFVVIVMSRSYMTSLNLALNRLFTGSGSILDTPGIKLNEEEKEIAFQYVELAVSILDSDLSKKRECIGSLISSIFHLAVGILTDRLSESIKKYPGSTDRSRLIFEKFLAILADNFGSQRSVSFYSNQLCLTPKYFSKLVKAASGRSAVDWIDSYVILEAKTLLKYSELTVKQIVARLNFADQPSFNKYFKAHTGMTPVEYRKS